MQLLAVCCNCQAWMVLIFFFFQAEDGIRDIGVTGVQTCALPISLFERGEPFFVGGQILDWKGKPAVRYKAQVSMGPFPGMGPFREEIREIQPETVDRKSVV